LSASAELLVFLPKRRKFRPERQKFESRRAESEGGVLGEGETSPRPPAMGSGERCTLHSRVLGRAPAAKRLSRVLSVQSSLFRWSTGIRGLMRGMATLPKVTRSY